jgi:Ca2+-binding RTX toxin-like protein
VDHSGASVAPATGTVTNLTTGTVTVNGTAAPLPLTFSVSQFENVIGSGFNDSITGDSHNNLLAGGTGNDILNGGVGSDQIFGDVTTEITGPIFTYNNKFYTLSAIGSWTQAQAQAVSVGGNLVTINDALENQFLLSAFGGNGQLWIGLTDAVNEGVFRWANGETVTYTNWAPGQPDNFRDEDYAEFNGISPGKWNDLPNATALRRGIIEIESSNDTIIASVGNDTINGGIGQDRVDYSALGGTVSLGTLGTLNKGVLGIDTLIKVETIVGSNLLGDTIDHSAVVAPASGTTTNLETGLVTVSGTTSPLPLSFTALQFENVTGSGFNDSITGNSGNNILRGGAGNDTIVAGTGVDTLNGGAGKDQVSGDGGNDVYEFTSLNDSLLSGFDVITNYTLGDVLDRPGTGGVLNSSSGISFGLTAAQVGSILNVFSFTANTSRAFTSVGFSGTFIAFNDSIAGFNELTDSILHLPSYNINLINTVTIV